ncbi:uncharacterized protein LOC120253307 [Dioscorea cayenensis subsp. rotundata]|uniref:Uncharacterized protein LOC120253307 n=1 Tax=Dioscorea cayennensis subsp. rotundata TaxID=55577 RepID=A0AB40AS59_DIOCR|nr:uncharacterized protein LOC120253307 [Dioscorea cayenensis subsp. rotundata]
MMEDDGSMEDDNGAMGHGCLGMDRVLPRRFSPSVSPLLLPRRGFSLPEAPLFTLIPRIKAFLCLAKKSDSPPYGQTVLKQSILDDANGFEDASEEVAENDGSDEFEEERGSLEEEFIEDLDDEILMEDDEDFEDDFEADVDNVNVGDGVGGGGVSLAGTWWDKKALSIAEEVSMLFDGDLKLYAFKTSANSSIRVRIEKLSNKSSSPSMADIQAFSSEYRARLDEAELAGTVPVNISLEVSSPGVERVVRIPEDLDRFKDRPMYVKYTADGDQESDGIFRLISFDLDLCNCTWGIADVKKNRQQAGKGRPLNNKQREWRLQTSFDSLRIVRLHSDC